MHMQKNRLFVIALFIGAVLLGYVGFAAAKDAAEPGSEPGSVEDPLVTKSFVEEYVRGYVSQAMPAANPLEWKVTTLEKGQQFIGKAGTEFIVRTGSAVVVDPTGNGIPDLTAGVNVVAGRPVEKNHLFTIPRTDGRGIQAQQQTIIMYRGI